MKQDGKQKEKTPDLVALIVFLVILVGGLTYLDPSRLSEWLDWNEVNIGNFYIAIVIVWFIVSAMVAALIKSIITGRSKKSN